MRILISDLPDDVTEEEIREALSPFAPVDAIKLLHESGKPAALIELETSREHAESLANRIAGRVYRGCTLNAWVPVMDWK